MTGQPRYLVWNLAFVGFEACLIGWTHFVVGVSWSTIGAGVAAVVAFGAILITYTVQVHTPRQRRQHRLPMQSHQTTQVAADNQPNQLPRALPGRHEVVDSQSMPQLPAPPLAADASRAH